MKDFRELPEKKRPDGWNEHGEFYIPSQYGRPEAICPDTWDRACREYLNPPKKGKKDGISR